MCVPYPSVQLRLDFLALELLVRQIKLKGSNCNNRVGHSHHSSFKFLHIFASKNVEWLQIYHWLKVHCGWIKRYISATKFIFISFWNSNIAFIIPSHFYYCAIFNSLNAGFFFNTINVSNSLDPDKHFDGPDLGPNCLQRLSADDKRLSG